MNSNVEKTLEFLINISDREVEDFSEKIMDDFEANPHGIRHFGGHLLSESGSENYSRFYINVIFDPKKLSKSDVLLEYIRSMGYECNYKI